MTSVQMSERVRSLTAGRVPFVHATVVRAQIPTSAHAGDTAIVLGDGTIEGFVGGQCAETSVRTAALSALVDGESLLLRILPGVEDAAFPDTPGAMVVTNPCLSGGALEIFLEPRLPAPLLEIVGTSPVAESLVRLAEQLGYATARSTPGVPPHGATGLVVASHGHDEETSIRAALDLGVPYIALVASPRRGDAVLTGLGLDADERARVHTPAGLDLGARTAGEIALSILAEFIIELRAGRLQVVDAAAPAPPAQVIDPVCGMTVIPMPDTPHLVVGDSEYWFCATGCRDRYAELAGL